MTSSPTNSLLGTHWCVQQHQKWYPPHTSKDSTLQSGPEISRDQAQWFDNDKTTKDEERHNIQQELALMIGINVDSRKLQVDVVNINGLGYFFVKLN